VHNARQKKSTTETPAKGVLSKAHVLEHVTECLNRAPATFEPTLQKPANLLAQGGILQWHRAADILQQKPASFLRNVAAKTYCT